MSASTAAELVLHAPAKVNLFLKVQGKRADGYHEIETVMQCVDLHDTLQFRSRSDGEIRLRMESARLEPAQPTAAREEIPVDERNLVVKAARLLQKTTGVSLGADILLRKRIPSQAGLGGGSADAGATLRGLNQLWQLRLTAQELVTLAATLGSDIPFFAADFSLARCAGRGETLFPEPAQPLHFVIAKPASGLSTAAVYARCEVSSFPQTSSDILAALRERQFSRLRQLLKNGLEQPARTLNSDVEHLLNIMDRQAYICSLLSGSGSACFGICLHRKQAISLARQLRNRTAAEVIVAQSRV